MSWTETHLVAAAFDFLGEDSPGSIDTPVGRLEERAKFHLKHIRDLVLKTHSWPAAMETVTLSEPLGLVDAEYRDVVQLPVDCLRVDRAGGSERGWVRRYGSGGGRLAGNFSFPLEIVYTRRLHYEFLPVELGYLVAAELAAHLAQMPTTRLPAGTYDRLRRMVDQKHAEALNMAISEGGTDRMIGSRFLDARDGLA